MKKDCQKDDGMNRRQFLLLAAAVAAGCQTVNEGAAPAAHTYERTIDAGPASNYARDGLYDTFREQGFFLIRTGGKLVAISSKCTHRVCKLTVEPDRSFYCECHGSTFDPNGKVTEGPATRDLPVFSTATDEKGHLIVNFFRS